MQNKVIKEKLDTFLSNLNDQIKNDDGKLLLSIDHKKIHENIKKAREELDYVDSKLSNKSKRGDSTYILDYILEKLILEFNIPDYIIIILQDLITTVSLDNYINGIDSATKYFYKLQRAITKDDYDNLMNKLFNYQDVNPEDNKSNAVKFPNK